MSSFTVDPKIGLRKCPDCGAVSSIVELNGCGCVPDWQVAAAMTQADVDALLEAERERVIRAAIDVLLAEVGDTPLDFERMVKDVLRGAK